MQSVVDIIERLGGTSAVAAALSLTPSTVSSWKTSGRIPRWREPALIAAAKLKGMPLTSSEIAQANAVEAPEQKAAA